MDYELIKIRLISFGWSFLGLFLTTIGGLLVSEDVQTLVSEHFGTGAVGMLLLLVITEAGKHLRNLNVQKKLGASEDKILI